MSLQLMAGCDVKVLKVLHRHMFALGKRIDLVPTTALCWEPPTKLKINVSLIHSMAEWLLRLQFDCCGVFKGTKAPLVLLDEVRLQRVGRTAMLMLS